MRRNVNAKTVGPQGSSPPPPQHRDAGFGETHAPHCGGDASVMSHWQNLPETLHRKVTRRRSLVTKPTEAVAWRGCWPPACRDQARGSHTLCRSRRWRPCPTLQDAVPGKLSTAAAGHREATRVPGARAGDLSSERTRARTSSPALQRLRRANDTPPLPAVGGAGRHGPAATPAGRARKGELGAEKQ